MSLNVFVRSPDTYSERRFDPNLTIGALKVRNVTSFVYTRIFCY